MLRNLPVGKKISFAFGCVIAIVIAVSAIIFIALGDQIEANSWKAHSQQVIDEAAGITESLINMETGLRGYAITGEDGLLDPFRAGQAAFSTHLQKARELTTDNKAQQDRLRSLEQQEQQWVDTFANPLLANRKTVDSGGMTSDQFVASFKTNTGKTRMDAMRGILASIYQDERSLEAGRSQSVQSDREITRAAIIGGGIVAVIVSVLLSIGLTRSIRNPIRQAVEAAENIAKGDLSSSIQAVSTDEPGMLLHALARMQNNLIGIVENIQHAAGEINAASQQLASGNMDLSARTEEQAASLEETASSMEELTATVRLNSTNAEQASHLASEASSTAIAGGELVSRVVETMSGINESSQKVSDIITTIEGIAFQTNILALNAAVEAARAGEQGRGFAVVAGEVRALAQRSASAAKEIKDLITDSVDRVKTGNQLVESTGSTMTQIVTSVQSVAAIMTEISSASTEQATGIEHVSQAVAQMDQATQQNAALVEEASAAATSLRDQAKRLIETALVFHTSRATIGRTPLKAADATNIAIPARKAAHAGMTKRPIVSVAGQRGPQRAAETQEWAQF